MEKELPSSAKAIIIGGGIAGCSVAYHLAKFGWKDIILLERDQLTSGTTWHAAGLVSQLGPSAGVTKIRKYSLELYKKLEQEIDFSIHYLKNKADISSCHYSYPEGQKIDFNDDVIQTLKKNGIKCCPTAMEGVNELRLSSLFHLKRVMVD